MSVAVNPGDNLATLTGANPNGTIFLLAAGTYAQQNVTPKPGNQYIGVSPAATILDGQATATYAFQRGGAKPAGVILRNMRVTNYLGTAGQGAILAGGDLASDGTTGWSLNNMEIDHIASSAVRTGHQMAMNAVYMHHCAVTGFLGFADDLVMDNCESSFNNIATSNADAGGCKLVLSYRPTIKNSRFRNNNGPNIWCDIGVEDYLIDNNLCDGAVQENIVIEISGRGRIRRNVILRGGLDDTRAASWAWGAGIGVHASGGTGLEIDENYIEGCAYGMSLIQQARGTNHGDPTSLRSDGTGIAAEQYVQNVNAHNNTIVMKSYAGHVNAGSLGAVWAVQDVADTAIFTSRNNRFTANKYLLRGADTTPFSWLNASRSYAYWTGTAGMEAGGSNLRHLQHYRAGDA